MANECALDASSWFIAVYTDVVDEEDFRHLVEHGQDAFSNDTVRPLGNNVAQQLVKIFSAKIFQPCKEFAQPSKPVGVARYSFARAPWPAEDSGELAEEGVLFGPELSDSAVELVDDLLEFLHLDLMFGRGLEMIELESPVLPMKRRDFDLLELFDLSLEVLEDGFLDTDTAILRGDVVVVHAVAEDWCNWVRAWFVNSTVLQAVGTDLALGAFVVFGFHEFTQAWMALRTHSGALLTFARFTRKVRQQSAQVTFQYPVGLCPCSVGP